MLQYAAPVGMRPTRKWIISLWVMCACVCEGGGGGGGCNPVAKPKTLNPKPKTQNPKPKTQDHQAN